MNLLFPLRTVTDSSSNLATSLNGKGGMCLNLGANY